MHRKDNAVTILPEDKTFGALKRLITKTPDSFFPIVDEGFHLRGILSLTDLRSVLFEDTLSDLLVVGELASPPISLESEESLYDALVKFVQTGYGKIPIEDHEVGVIGVLRLGELMEAYHREIQRLEEEQ